MLTVLALKTKAPALPRLVLVKESYAVKVSRIVAQDLFDQTPRQIFTRFHLGDEMRLLRWIVVTIVGADDQVIRANMLGEVVYVLVGLAGDVHAAVGKQIGAGLP